LVGKAKWISNDVPFPKEAVCEQSMALLSAIVQAFTQYSSLHQYLVVCAELTLGKLNSDSGVTSRQPAKG